VTSFADRLVRRASVAASVGFVVVLAGTAGTIAWPRVASALGIQPAGPPPAYEVGSLIDTPAAWHETADSTLVLFARASCGASQKAQPFLAELVGALQRDGRAAVVASVGQESFDEDAAFARGLGVAADRVRATPAGARVRATPTLVLVTRTGRVLRSWEGVGPAQSQQEILKTLETTLAGR